MTSDPPATDGRLLDDRYRLGSLLGVGGVATVYRAIDERLHRGVAVKLFRGDVADQLQRHEEEMRTLARLNHASLVTVYDAGRDETTGQPYLVMALVEGSTLADRLLNGALTTQRTAEIGAAVADALAYVHGQGLVHRDVKPANVLISNAGRVFLADFGIARLVDSAHVTQAGDVLGTPSFFAPEQVSGEPVGPPADVYALGLVLLECLTGQREYDGTSLEVAMARLNRQPNIPPVLPPAWREVLAGMTARQPAARLSAAQVEERLRRIAEGDDRTMVTAPVPYVADPATMAMPPAGATQMLPPPLPGTGIYPPPSVPPAPYPTRRRRPWLAVLVVCILIVVAAGVAVAVVDRNKNNGSTTCSAGTAGLSGTIRTRMQALNATACPPGVSNQAARALAVPLGNIRNAAAGTDRKTLSTQISALQTVLETLVAQQQITESDEVVIEDAAGQLQTAFNNKNPAASPSPTPSTTSPSSSVSVTPSSVPPTTPSSEPPTTPSSEPPTTPSTTPPTSASTSTSATTGSG